MTLETTVTAGVPSLASALSQLDANADGVAMYFTSHLLATHPDLIDRWPVGLGAQRRSAYHALRDVVEAVENGRDVSPRLVVWARGFARMSLAEDDLTSMAVSLEATLRRFLGDTFVDAYADRLAAVHRAVMPTIARQLRGYDESPGRVEAEVVEHAVVAGDLAVLTLRPAVPVTYTPGQSLPVASARRPKVWRPFTPAHPPRQDGSVEIHVRAVAGGYLSPALVYETGPGDVVALARAVGTLGWAPGGSDAVLLAAGTGLAPFSAMLHERARVRVDEAVPAVRLIVCAPSARELYLTDDVQRLADTADWLTLDTVTGADSPETIVGGGRWVGHDLYVCGSQRFVGSVTSALVTGGHQRGDIHVEEYGGPSPAPMRALGGAQ